jgi:hypothetical protein
MNWKYTDDSRQVVARARTDGGMESMLASAVPTGEVIDAPDAAPVVVPASVTRFQARAALADAGLLDRVEAMMADTATPIRMRLAWTDAQEFLRESPTVLAMGAALGLDAAALDALFTHAITIVA